MIKPNKYFHYKKKKLYAENVSVEKIIKRVGTPAYIYSQEAILEPIRALKKHLSGIDYLICYAIKANSNSTLLNLIKKEGLGLDIVSGGELYQANKLKFNSQKIIFSGVGKTKDEIVRALRNKNGILSFNVESVEELTFLEKIARSIGKKANVSLRFNPDIDAKTHPYISTGLKMNKFGILEKDILPLIKKWKNSQTIQIVGLSIHIGSQILNLGPLKDSFKKTRLLQKKVEKALGRSLQFIDLGGGLGITYQNETPPSIKKYCDLIKKIFPDIKIILEPGRFIVGNAGILATQILYRKKAKPTEFLIVDAGMNDLIRPALYQGHHQIIALNQKGSSFKKMHVVGPVCESADFLAQNRPMKSHLKEGDFLAVLSAGAYCFSMSSHYNGRPKPVEVLVSKNQFRIIRKRESLDAVL